MKPGAAQYRAELHKFFGTRSVPAGRIDDLIQEVYERLLRYSPKESIQDAKAYVFQIAWNVLRDANHSIAVEKRRYIFCDPGELEGRIENARPLWTQEEYGLEMALEEIQRVLDELPLNCRTAYLLHRRDRLSYKQIADALGVSTHSVKKYIGKAFHHFRLHFDLKHGR